MSLQEVRSEQQFTHHCPLLTQSDPDAWELQYPKRYEDILIKAKL